MGYLYLFIAAIMWSFVGVMVKAASSMVDSSIITLCRFLFGFIVLGLLLLIKDKKLRLFWKDKWIWIGVIGKSCNYVLENIAILMGFAYGNVVVWPVQAVFLACVAVLVLKEEAYPERVMAVVLCVLGVVLVSWKGMSVSGFLGAGLIPTVLFIFSAIGSGIHIISQKKLIGYMDSGNMNFSVFFLSSIVTAVPIPFSFKFSGHIGLWPALSLIGLGVVTGISFYIYAEALKRVSFLVAVVGGNLSVLFTLLWAYIFFRETANAYAISGIVILLAGLVIINIPKGKLFGRAASRRQTVESGALAEKHQA